MSRLLHSLPRAAGGRTMDSIVRDVVRRSGVQPRLPEFPTQTTGLGAEDAELERILASLRTNIKIVGIGGGGCNTIDRLVESGIDEAVDRVAAAAPDRPPRRIRHRGGGVVRREQLRPHDAGFDE